MDTEKRVNVLVDKIMDEGFETYSKIKVAVKKVDLILDTLNECGCGPKVNREGDEEPNAYGDGESLDTAEDLGDLEGVEPEETYDAGLNTVNDIPHVPNQVDAVQAKQVSNQLGESTLLTEEYQAFFKMMMKRHGVQSIGSLTPEQKADFFNKVKAEWQRAKVIKRISS